MFYGSQHFPSQNVVFTVSFENEASRFGSRCNVNMLLLLSQVYVLYIYIFQNDFNDLDSFRRQLWSLLYPLQMKHQIVVLCAT